MGHDSKFKMAAMPIYGKNHSTLVAMATVHEKFQMTFPMKVLSQFE